MLESARVRRLPSASYVYDMFWTALVPPRPAVIAASASLFGEWAASLVPLDQLPNDPNIKQAIADALPAL